MSLVEQLNISRPFRFLILAEAVTIFVSLKLGAAVNLYFWTGRVLMPPFDISDWIFTAVLLLCGFAMGLHSARYANSFTETVSRTLASFLLALVVIAALSYFFPVLAVWRPSLGAGILAGIVLILLLRFGALQVMDRGQLKRPILVIGAGALAHKIQLLERFSPLGNFRCLGFVRAGSESIAVDRGSVLGELEDLEDLLAELRVNEIVVALQDRRGTLPIRQLIQIRLGGTMTTDFISFIERETGKVDLDAIRPSWFIFSPGFPVGRVQTAVKRLFDISVSLTLLIFTMPLWVATALAIRLSSPGPILFRQKRVGLGGREFTLYKFRSMRIDAEETGPQWAARNDPRVTRLGMFIRKTRLDELPQLVNVLGGEMSFVGPRPEQPHFVEMLTDEIPFYAERHSVKPGITGWAQLHYSYGASVEDARQKLQYDLYYIKHYSLLLDLLIIVQTVRVILWSQGAR